MIAITEGIGAIIILKDIQPPEVLGLEPIGQDRIEAFLLIDYAVPFDDNSPFSNVSLKNSRFIVLPS